MTKKRIIFIATIILLTSLLSWLTLRIIEKKSATTHINKPHNPDAIVINAVYTQMNKNGTISHVMSTPKLIHYPYQNSSAFQNPIITIMNTTAKPWQITSDSGTSQYGSNIISLLNNVKLHRTAGPNNSELTVTTTAATIYAKKKYVTTDRPITIKKTGITIKAVGANAYLDKKIINLLAQVRETHDPTKK